MTDLNARHAPGRQILFIKALCEPGFEEPDYKGENRQFDEEANLTTQDSDSTDSDSTDSDSTITNTTPKQTIPNPNFNNTITHHAGGMPVCFDQRPELDFDYLVRIVSDVNVQIEMACKTPGMFDEDYFPVTVSAYALDNCPHADAERDLLERTGTHEGLVGIDRVNAVLYGPLKNLEALLANFLSQVDNWGARARHMEVVTIPSINRVLLHGVRPGHERKMFKMVRNLLKDNGAINTWYINTFNTHSRQLETPIMEMRGLAEFLFLICDEGNELIEELLGGPLIRPWSNKRKASDSSNPNHGHGNPDEGNADSSASKEGANVKNSSSKDGHNAKSSSSKEVNIPDLAAALRSILGSKWEPTPEPSLLRVTNPNLSSMTMQPEPERRDQPYNHRKGPTEDNLMNMSKQEYLDTRFDQDFYARSPAQLAAMTHEDEPLWKRGPTRDDRLKALATTPKWKKLLSDKHYIDSLFVGSKELDIFNQALILANNALAKAEECAQSLENSGKLATRMMADYDAFEENVNEMEWRILNGGFKEQENIVEGESEGWWSGGNGRGEMEGVVKDEGKGKGKEEGYVGKGKGKA